MTTYRVVLDADGNYVVEASMPSYGAFHVAYTAASQLLLGTSWYETADMVGKALRIPSKSVEMAVNEVSVYLALDCPERPALTLLRPPLNDPEVQKGIDDFLRENYGLAHVQRLKDSSAESDRNREKYAAKRAAKEARKQAKREKWAALLQRLPGK